MTDLTCHQVEEAATEYALGILPADEARGVSTHILRCPACRQEVEDIRQTGDQLLDLVPDAEPPVGFDQRLLSALQLGPARRRGKLRLMVAAAAAAAVIAVGAVTATAVAHHQQAHPAELTAVFHEGNQTVGTVYVGGHPTWISMTVNHLSLSGTVSCQLTYKDGTVTSIGTFALVDGSGSWGAPDPATRSEPLTARLVGPAGTVIASASFSPT